MRLNNVSVRLRILRLNPATLLILAMLLFIGLTSTGCVRRRLTIRSNPPGAHVFVDDQEIGFTPVSTSFVYYGTRTIRLEKDGFETLTVKQNFHPTWYEIPPLDLVSETLYPGELRDERGADFQLIPAQIVPQQDLINRAEGLRGTASQGQAIPLINPGVLLTSRTSVPSNGADPAEWKSCRQRLNRGRR